MGKRAEKGFVVNPSETRPCDGCGKTFDPGAAVWVVYDYPSEPIGTYEKLCDSCYNKPGDKNDGKD